jgi:hypothetical protein
MLVDCEIAVSSSLASVGLIGAAQMWHNRFEKLL